MIFLKLKKILLNAEEIIVNIAFVSIFLKLIRLHIVFLPSGNFIIFCDKTCFLIYYLSCKVHVWHSGSVSNWVDLKFCGASLG